jgi:cell division transport system permease protein
MSQAPLATLFNVLVIGVALALPLGGYVMLSSLESLSRNLSTEPQLSVFLARDTGKSEAAAVEMQLKRADGIRSVRFLSRDAALAGLKHTPGMTEVIATLRDNPLPDAFVVTLAANDGELADRLERQFKSLPKVTHVQADSAWMRRMDTLLHLGRTTIVLLGMLLSFALVAVTFNTIRLQILTQRDEIEVSRLIGATRAYICRPFFYLGSLLGLLGGAAGLAIVFSSMAVLNRDLAQLGVLYDSDFRLHFPAPADATVILAFSALLGWMGAYLSVSRHLREIEQS